MPELQTQRLLLRHLTAGDVDDLFSMDGDARVMRFLGNGLPPRSRAECEAGLARSSERYREQPGFGLLHASTRDDGRFVGACGLFRVPGAEDIEIAYRLPFACWGHGYATEMARAVLARGFATLGLARVVGLTWPENLASQRVLEKIGMQREGIGHHYGREMVVFAATSSGVR